MQEEWWERSTCFLCDRWWLLLLILASLLAGWFARGYWLSQSGLTNLTPDAISLSEFADGQGAYTLAYPSNWPVEDLGNQTQQWLLPEGATMSVHSEPMLPGDTLESYAQEVVSRLPYEVLKQSYARVGEQPAIRQEVAYPGQVQRIAVGYLVLYKGQKYQIALAGLQRLSENDQERVIQEFEQVLTTFRFQQ